jgi:hypothetical protein
MMQNGGEEPADVGFLRGELALDLPVLCPQL